MKRSKIAKRGLRDGSLVLLGVNGNKWVLENPQTKERMEFLKDLAPDLFWYSKRLTPKMVIGVKALEKGLSRLRFKEFDFDDRQLRELCGYKVASHWEGFIRHLTSASMVDCVYPDRYKLITENMQPKEIV